MGLGGPLFGGVSEFPVSIMPKVTNAPEGISTSAVDCNTPHFGLPFSNSFLTANYAELQDTSLNCTILHDS